MKKKRTFVAGALVGPVLAYAILVIYLLARIRPVPVAITPANVENGEPERDRRHEKRPVAACVV